MSDVSLKVPVRKARDRGGEVDFYGQKCLGNAVLYTLYSSVSSVPTPTSSLLKGFEKLFSKENLFKFLNPLQSVSHV